jgi:hypothetical protein
MNSWGILGKPTPEKVQEWANMPYGKFKEMVTGIKKQTKGKPLRKYAIEVQDIATSYRTAFINVEAATADQAIKLAQIADKNTFEWSDPKQEKYNKYSYRVSQVWD